MALPAGAKRTAALFQADRLAVALLLTTPVLRRRAACHAGMFGSFSLFWTVTPLMLPGAQFHLSQTGIAVFALALLYWLGEYAGHVTARGKTA